jgi:septum formation protein
LSNIDLVLASGSPRRREMLEKMGVSFSVYVTTTDESRKEGEAPEDLVTRLARDKAKMAYTDLAKDNVAILAADTIVVQGDFVYGKPTNFEHAQQIWHSLSANKHQVMTAVCLFHDGRTSVKLGITEVEFGRVTAEQMERYWLTGEPLDKAGAYAIQGYASAWVKSIHGSYSNVVGLPLREVNELLVTIDRNWL